MSTQQETFTSIVVVGAMNPPIHHPSWYSAVGILDESQVQEAIANPQFVCIPQLAQFQTDAFRIGCLQERWDVGTSKSADIVEIACKTFEILKHTPVSAIGLNFNYHRATKVAVVDRFLGRLIVGLPLGISEVSDPLGSRVSFKQKIQERVFQVTIEPSTRAGDMVYVAINSHYDIQGLVPASSGKNFELSPLLRKAMVQDRRVAEAFQQRIVESVR